MQPHSSLPDIGDDCCSDGVSIESNVSGELERVTTVVVIRDVVEETGIPIHLQPRREDRGVPRHLFYVPSLDGLLKWGIIIPSVSHLCHPVWWVLFLKYSGHWYLLRICSLPQQV